MLGQQVMAALADRQVEHVGTDLDVDLCDPAAVARHGEQSVPTVIVNCAAYTNVDGAEADERSAFAVNADGPENLGRTALHVGATVVHFSTDYVFDGTGHDPYVESDPPGPLGIYGKSKYEGERRLLALGCSLVLIRTSWLFGPGGKNFVATMLDLMSSREELRVVSDQIGRPTYAPDLADAALDLAGLGAQPAVHRGTHHVANNGTTSWHGFACKILERAPAFGRAVVTRTIHPIATHEFPRPAPRPAWSVLDTTRAERALGRPLRHWTEALDEYLDATRPAER